MDTLIIATEIKKELEKVYEFIKNDENTKTDFEEYLKTLGVYGTLENKMSEYYVPYIFEREIPNLKQNPIMFYNEKFASELSTAMERAFTSIFQIKKVLKNGFEAYNLINEKIYTLNITSKMTDYRGIGVGQFLVARIFKYKEETYIIEVSGHLSLNKSQEAMRYAMAKIIQEPYLVYEDNKEKEQEIQNNIKLMYDKFIEAFSTDEIITSSKHTDEIIGKFNEYTENGTPVDINDLLKIPQTPEYFEITDLNNNYENFVEKSLDGFSSHKKEYDTGIICDKNYGLYVIPFYNTLLKILEENSTDNVKGAKECIDYFITSPTIPPNIIKRICNKFPNFLDMANNIKGENLSLDEMFIKYKHEYVSHKIYSQTTILYNSKVFTNTLGIVVENESRADVDYSKVKRNDLCPCGSGKKFKHCCMK